MYRNFIKQCAFVSKYVRFHLMLVFTIASKTKS